MAQRLFDKAPTQFGLKIPILHITGCAGTSVTRQLRIVIGSSDYLLTGMSCEHQAQFIGMPRQPVIWSCSGGQIDMSKIYFRCEHPCSRQMNQHAGIYSNACNLQFSLVLKPGSVKCEHCYHPGTRELSVHNMNTDTVVSVISGNQEFFDHLSRIWLPELYNVTIHTHGTSHV